MKAPGETPEQMLHKWEMRFPLFCVLLFLAGVSGYLARPVWFDEVLTLDWLRYPLYEIPFHYEIPNNHIVYTVLLKLWKETTELCGFCGTLYLRMLSAIFGVGVVLLIYRRLKRTCGAFPALLCTALLAISEPMRQYGSALRGYMPGLFFAFSAFLFAERFIKQGRKKDLVFYIFSGLLSVGTLPSNLLILWISALFLAPFFSDRRKRSGIWALFYLPPLLLLIWYFPILPQFIDAARLPEGWYSRSGSLFDLIFCFLFIFLPVLPFSFLGFRRIFKYHRIRLRLLLMLAILLAPILLVFLFMRPPFPRLFFPLSGLVTLIIGIGFSGFLRGHSKIFPCVCVGIWILSAQFLAEPVTQFFYGKRGDDLISPYYLKNSFQPQKTVNPLIQRFKEGLSDLVFIHFDSDAPSLKFMLLNLGFPEEQILNDRPDLGKVVRFPGSGLIICNGAEQLDQIKAKFGLTGKYRRIDGGTTDSLQKLYVPENE